jgi:hypothetical protein
LSFFPEIADVAAYMRLDGDSCIGPGRESPLALLSNGVVDVTNDRIIDQSGVYEDLETLARDYLRYFEVEIRNAGVWESAFVWGAVKGYYDNFEVMDIKL